MALGDRTGIDLSELFSWLLSVEGIENQLNDYQRQRREHIPKIRREIDLYYQSRRALLRAIADNQAADEREQEYRRRTSELYNAMNLKVRAPYETPISVLQMQRRKFRPPQADQGILF